MSILFINASPNREGETARLAHRFLEDKDFRTINLVDLKIFPYGQTQFEGDQFDEVVAAMREADDIVMGSPLYWHSMGGMLRNLLDRSYEAFQEQELAPRRLWFIFQGAAPTQAQLEAGDFTMGRYASLYGMRYQGMITNEREARTARAQLNR
ncbi:MAG: flavodoxin family protein [Eggerthellaceae bacterium]|jgi:multimeric flavodoxin WrbA